MKCRSGDRVWDCWFNPGNLSLDRPDEEVISLISGLGELVYIASGRIRDYSIIR